MLAVLTALLITFAIYHHLPRQYVTTHMPTDQEYIMERIRVNKEKVLAFEKEHKEEQEDRLGSKAFETAQGVHLNNKELRKIEGTNEFRPHGVYDRDQLIEAIYVMTVVDLAERKANETSDLRKLISKEVGYTRR